MNNVNTLINEALRSSLSPSTMWDTEKVLAVSQEKGSQQKLTMHAASRTVGSGFLLSYPIWVFC